MAVHLLPDPGAEVALELLEEIMELRGWLEEADTQLRNTLGKLYALEKTGDEFSARLRQALYQEDMMGSSAGISESSNDGSPEKA